MTKKEFLDEVEGNADLINSSLCDYQSSCNGENGEGSAICVIAATYSESENAFSCVIRCNGDKLPLVHALVKAAQKDPQTLDVLINAVSVLLAEG